MTTIIITFYERSSLLFYCCHSSLYTFVRSLSLLSSPLKIRQDSSQDFRSRIEPETSYHTAGMQACFLSINLSIRHYNFEDDGLKLQLSVVFKVANRGGCTRAILFWPYTDKQGKNSSHMEGVGHGCTAQCTVHTVYRNIWGQVSFYMRKCSNV